MYTIKIIFLSSIKLDLNNFINFFKTKYKNIFLSSKPTNLFLSKINKSNKKLSLLKSPHVNKTAWHQFQQTNYSQNIIIKHLSLSQIKIISTLLFKYKPTTIQIKINFIN